MKLLQIPGCRVCQLAGACAHYPAAANALRETYPEIRCPARRKGARVFWDGQSYAEVSCTLGARCGKLVEATLRSVRFFRYRGSSRRGRASR